MSTQREVRIELHTDDKDGEPEKLPDYYPHGYAAGVWQDNGRDVFGLTYDGHPTHMSYGLEYFRPKEIPEELARRGTDRFYFDAGNTRAALWVYVGELVRAFQELGLLDDSKSNPSDERKQ